MKEVFADGTVSYTYDADGRLVKGEKSDGSSSSYAYDAMGARTRNVQVRENENTGAANADLADGSHGIDYMNFLKDLRAVWQRAFETEVGTTVQNDYETVTRKYAADYLSAAYRDILVTEEGGYIARYVYDADGRRVSAEFAYADGTARGAVSAAGEYGENLMSDRAASEGKFFSRSDALGSSLVMLDASCEVVLHMEYDAWGCLKTDQCTDINYAGLEAPGNFTGNTYDVTLQLYFAQSRFYDAADHRFISEDAAQDGSNWYIYCRDNPVMYADADGMYAKLNGHYVSTYQDNGTTYSEIRELLLAYGAAKDSIRYERSSSRVTGDVGEWTFVFAMTGKTDSTAEFEAYAKHKASGETKLIDTSKIRYSDGYMNIDLDYFHDFMCRQLDKHVPDPVVDDSFAGLNYYEAKEIGISDQKIIEITKYYLDHPEFIPIVANVGNVIEKNAYEKQSLLAKAQYLLSQITDPDTSLGYYNIYSRGITTYGEVTEYYENQLKKFIEDYGCDGSPVLNQALLYLLYKEADDFPAFKMTTPLQTMQITGGYGYRDIDKKKYPNASDQHEGLDFMALNKTLVYATMPGTVVDVNKTSTSISGRGRFVAISYLYNPDIVTYSQHLSEVSVEKNDIVASGQIIGKTGNTGAGNSYHFHFSVTENGKPVNPLKYLDF